MNNFDADEILVMPKGFRGGMSFDGVLSLILKQLIVKIIETDHSPKKITVDMGISGNSDIIQAFRDNRCQSDLDKIFADRQKFNLTPQFLEKFDFEKVSDIRLLKNRVYFSSLILGFVFNIQSFDKLSKLNGNDNFSEPNSYQEEAKFRCISGQNCPSWPTPE